MLQKNANKQTHYFHYRTKYIHQVDQQLKTSSKKLIEKNYQCAIISGLADGLC